MHGVGQGGIEQAVVPDRCFASGMSGFQSAHFSSDAVALSRLDEFEHAGAFIEQRGCKRGVARQHRHQPVAEGLGLLKIIGLEKGQGALVNVARVRRLHHLKAEEGRALLGLVGDQQHGQGRRELPPRSDRGRAGACRERGGHPVRAWQPDGCGIARRENDREWRRPKGCFPERFARAISAILPRGNLISPWLTRPRRKPSIVVRPTRGWGLSRTCRAGDRTGSGLQNPTRKAKL